MLTGSLGVMMSAGWGRGGVISDVGGWVARHPQNSAGQCGPLGGEIVVVVPRGERVWGSEVG